MLYLSYSIKRPCFLLSLFTRALSTPAGEVLLKSFKFSKRRAEWNNMKEKFDKKQVTILKKVPCHQINQEASFSICIHTFCTIEAC